MYVFQDAYLEYDPELIENCTIVENKAGENGGAFYLEESSLILKNTTLKLNKAGINDGGDSKGGGILNILFFKFYIF